MKQEIDYVVEKTAGNGMKVLAKYTDRQKMLADFPGIKKENFIEIEDANTFARYNEIDGKELFTMPQPLFAKTTTLPDAMRELAPYKINLASGQRPFERPWINIDKIEQGYPVDILTDASDLSLFPDESVEIIVAHHLVEHIAIHDLEGYVREWRRVLKRGGLLAVFVPNLRELDKAWTDPKHPNKVNTFIHNVNTYGAWQGHIEDLHKWGYDEQELVDRITQEGRVAWQVRDYNPANPIYRGASIAQDWWILSKEFVKV